MRIQEGVPHSDTKKHKRKRKLEDESVDQLKKLSKKNLKVANEVEDIGKQPQIDKIKKKKKSNLDKLAKEFTEKNNDLNLNNAKESEQPTPTGDKENNTNKAEKSTRKRKINKTRHKRKSKYEDKKAKRVLESMLTKDDSKKLQAQAVNETEENQNSMVKDNDIKCDKKPKRKKKDKAKPNVSKEDPGEETQKSEAAKKQAISYLSTWKNDKPNWSFKKSRQIWLIKNMYSNGTLRDKDFAYLAEYLEGSKGAVRTRLIETAQNIYDSLANKDVNEIDNIEITKRDRARTILQALSE